MAKKPKVAFIATVYNGQQYLAEAINSILDQNLKDIEILYVDDGSTDNTIDILKYYKNKDPRFHYWRFLKNRGISKALNFITKKVTAPIICIASADDVYTDYRAKMSYEALKDGKHDAFYGAFLRAREQIMNIQRGYLADGTEAGICRTIPYTPGCLEKKQVIPHGFLSIRTEFAKKVPYRKDLKVGIDYPYIKDLEAAGCRWKWTNEVLGIYRLHKKSVSITRRDEVNRSTDIVGGWHE